MTDNTTPTTASIAAGLSESERDALQKIDSGNGAIYTGDFYSLLEKKLVDMTGIVPLGRDVLAALQPRPTTITAAEFVSEGYAEKISRRECIVMRNKDERILTVRLSEFDNCPIEVIKPYDSNIYESASVDEAQYIVEWLTDTPPTATDREAAGEFDVGMIHADWWYAAQDASDGVTTCAYGRTREEAIIRLKDVLELATLRTQLSAAEARAEKAEAALRDIAEPFDPDHPAEFVAYERQRIAKKYLAAVKGGE